MFDIGWSELVLIGVVALIVIGPKELPGVLRAVGQWSAKIRRMAAEFQGQFQEALREVEVADLKKQVDEITDSARSIGRFDPLTYDPGKETSPPPADSVKEISAPQSAANEVEAPPESSTPVESDPPQPTAPPSEVSTAPPSVASELERGNRPA
ncbi:MAG: Sec-independent protein translocase protein TatB [Rhodoplanes sp.]